MTLHAMTRPSTEPSTRIPEVATIGTTCAGGCVPSVSAAPFKAAVRASDLARTGRAAASPDLGPGRDQPTYMARDIARTVVVDRVSGSTAGVDDAGRVGEPEGRIPFSGGLS